MYVCMNISMNILNNANELYDDIFTIIISIYINHNHHIYNDNINIH